MAKQKRKLIKNLVFEVYDKGLQQNDCNLTDCYEKIPQALNIPLVSKRCFCGAAWDGITCDHCGFDASEVNIY
jgi:hypothetical protein